LLEENNKFKKIIKEMKTRLEKFENHIAKLKDKADSYNDEINSIKIQKKNLSEQCQNIQINFEERKKKLSAIKEKNSYLLKENSDLNNKFNNQANIE